MRICDAIPAGPGFAEWAAAGRPFPGETESGDRLAVRPVTGGLMAAVIDGLGHGEEAAEAARIAADVFLHANLRSLRQIFEEVHGALRGSRGAVAAAAIFAPAADHLEWTGVGNIEGFLVRANADSRPPRHYLLSRGGVLGCEPLPAIRTDQIRLEPGDTLVLATDGIASSFYEAIRPGTAPAAIAGHILEDYGRDTDDALILVARYREEGG